MRFRLDLERAMLRARLRWSPHANVPRSSHACRAVVTFASVICLHPHGTRLSCSESLSGVLEWSSGNLIGRLRRLRSHLCGEVWRSSASGRDSVTKTYYFLETFYASRRTSFESIKAIPIHVKFFRVRHAMRCLPVLHLAPRSGDAKQSRKLLRNFHPAYAVTGPGSTRHRRSLFEMIN